MNLIPFAKKLRQNSTDAENALWYFLRAKRLCGLKFRRQRPIGKFIVDFVCLEKKIIVELDGSQHFEDPSKDQRREKWLNDQGYKVMRFDNIEFLKNKEAAVEKIAEICLNKKPSPCALSQKMNNKVGEGKKK